MAQTKAQLLGPVVGDVVMDVSTLSLDAEGNKVGIGTTEADLTLHVNGVNALPSSSGSTPTGHLTLRAKATSSTHGMFMGVSDASPWSSWIQAQDATNNATNYPLLLNPNGGSIGIGTTVPSSYYANNLVVHGSGEGGITIVGPSTGNSYLSFADGTTGNERYRGYLRYEHPTDTLKLATGADIRMSIIANGNVGIGTTAPAVKLHVAGSGDPTLQISDTDGTNQHVMLAHNGGDSYILTQNNTSHGEFLVYSSNGTTTESRLKVDVSGRLLLGTTTSPSSGDGQYAKLSVSGYVGGTPGGASINIMRDEAATAMSSGDTVGALQFTDINGLTFASIKAFSDGTSGGVNGVPGALSFRTESTGSDGDPVERLRITSAGLLQLDNGNQITASDTTTYIGLGGGNSTSNGANMFLYGGSHASNASAFVFRTNTTERLRITSGGALNIGKGDESTNASNLVEMYVGGSDEAYGTIRGKYNRTNEYNRSEIRFGVENNANGLGFLAFATGNNSATERLRITSGGYIGVNVGSNIAGNATLTPWTNFHIVGSNVADGVSARTDATPTGQLHVSSSGWGANQGGTISLGSEADNVNPNAAYASISGRRVSSLGYQYGGYLTLNVSDGSTLDEKLRILSSGQVVIGESTNYANANADDLIVGNRSNNESGITIGSTNQGQIAFADSGADRAGLIHYQHTDNSMRFYTNGPTNERLRITSDGKVGVGCNPEVDFQVRNANGGTLKIGGSGTGATGFQIQYNNSGTTTTEILTNYRATNGSASLKLDTGTLKIATGTSGTDQLIIDSSGRILKGMASSILGSSDVQLKGSGGPAKIAGYKSDNNPTANNSLLTVTGYSQSGTTFTGVSEIDFRVDQNSNTVSGYHPGSIVTRVNGGSATGTHGGLTYSYAGLKDRERITFKSKRYYSLPEWHSGNDTYNTFREEWDYQHYVGYNQYSWYRFTSHSGNSSRGGSVDIRVTWTTRHAAGNGYGHYAFHWRDNHSTGYMEIGNVYRYHQHYLNGSYYGWSSNPALDVYEINDNGDVAGFYLRVQGHVAANSGTYDGGAMHQFLISAHTNRYGADVNKFEFVGNSTPSDVGSIQGNVNLP